MIETTTNQKWALASVVLTDGVTDFFLSRQAMQCSQKTLKFYKDTISPFIKWIEGQGLTRPDEITARHVRAYLAELTGRKLQDTSIHAHARAIRTLLRFWHAEKYMPEVKFEMPKLAHKQLPRLTLEQLKKVVAACDVRDRAIVLLIADSGLRRAEVCALNWTDINFSNGIVRVHQGKGRKDRSSVVSPKTRRALLMYRRTLDSLEPSGAIFLSQHGGERLTSWGLGLIFSRLSKKTGIKVSAHALRRTWVSLSRRAGMSDLHLVALGGWTDLAMVRHYDEMSDDDLVQGHSEHSPLNDL